MEKTRMKQLVKKNMLEFDERHEAFELHFDKTNDTLDKIEHAQRATYRLLSVRLGIFEHIMGSTKEQNNVLDENINS